MPFKLKVLILSSCFLSLPAYASGWYMGVGVGTAQALDADSNVANSLSALAGAGISSVGSYDTNASALTLFGGFRFNRNFAVELGYADLGSYNLNVLATSGGSTVAASETDDVSALSLSAVGIIPLDGFVSIFGKLGVASTADSESCSVTGTSCSSTTDYSLDPIVGVGGEINLGPRWALRLELDQYYQIGNTANEYTAGDFRLVTFSGLFRF